MKCSDDGKRRISSAWVFIAISLITLGPALLSAQNSSSFNWTYQKIDVSPVVGAIKISLQDLPHGAEYVIGLRSAKTAVSQAEFVIGAVHFGSMAGPIHLISSIDNWPAAQLKTAPGELDVSGILTGGPALLIYGSIPSGTTVQINGPGGPIASGAVKSGGSLMVYDGSVMGQQVAGVRTLIPYLLHPHANSTREGNQSGLVATNDGRYFANPAVLASHLVSFTRPSYPAGEVPPQFSSARLAITIGTDGNVQDIRQVGGDRAALNACEAALHSWRFKPFSFKGQAAVVEAPVVFFFSQTGKVTSPVFSELAR